jgi:hypothetical protein
VCDYHKPYATLAPFHSYPGTVVNVSRQRAGGTVPRVSDHYRDFGRPVMGGLDRKGTLASGRGRRLHSEVAKVLADRPPRFILSADCTVSGQTSWETIRSVVEMAHGSGAKQ